jgi:hypothetical protein
MRRLCRRAIFRLERLRAPTHILLMKISGGEQFMASPSWDRLTPDEHDNPSARGLDRYDPCEIDPPEPLQMFARLGLFLMISLAFALIAELLVRMPPH